MLADCRSRRSLPPILGSTPRQPTSWGEPTDPLPSCVNEERLDVVIKHINITTQHLPARYHLNRPRRNGRRPRVEVRGRLSASDCCGDNRRI